MQVSRETEEWIFWGLMMLPTIWNGRIKLVKNLTLPFYYQFIQYPLYIYYIYIYLISYLPLSVLSVLVNEPLGVGQSVFLAYQVPSHHVKKHIENTV